MTNESFQDKLDAFMAGNMPQNARLDFEAEMSRDPLLKNELELQHDIAKALGEQRRMALKNRLQKIDVSTIPAGSSVSLGMRTLAGLGAAAGVVGIAALVFMNSGKETVPVSQPVAGNTTATEQQNNSHIGSAASEPAIETTDNTNTGVADVADHTAAPGESPDATANTAESHKADANTSEAVNKPGASTHSNSASGKHTSAVTSKSSAKAAKKDAGVSPMGFDPSANIGGDDDAGGAIKTSSADGGHASGSPATTRLTDGMIEDQKVVNDGKHTDHYTYTGSKLVLYFGSDKALYELLDLDIAKGGKKIYIYRNGIFAQVMPNTHDITKFVAITDPQLVSELTELKKKKGY
ncbi:MAG: hypothetical protein V4543_02970 [Bacteroidota bacterium]